jgi:NADH:ubiquinone reductase (H+-translocating)
MSTTHSTHQRSEDQQSDDHRTEVVIVGGGFAGVGCANRLAGRDDVRVTIFDKNGFHQFQPLLYQVATAELTREDIVFDLDDLFAEHDNVTAVPVEVTATDPASRTVTLADGSVVAADILVLAAGAQPNFFQTPGAPDIAFPLYSLDDAQRVRSRVIQLFEDVAGEPALVDAGALNFVIVGAGPTGIEIAGALSELIHDVMPHRYPDMEIDRARVVIVDHGDNPLAAFSDAAHAYARKQLRHRGVELMVGAGVAEVGRDHVTLTDGTVIPTHLTVWGGGEMAADVVARSGVDVGRGGRVTVQPDLSVDGYPGVYAVGDAANIPGPSGEILPQLGSVAQQSGDWVGRTIIASIEGEKTEPFEYHDKGIMAMIGRRAAVAEIGEHRHELHGRVAFAAWLGVHAALLSNLGAETRAFLAWAEEFYVRPSHRSAELLDPSLIDTPRIRWRGDNPSAQRTTRAKD